MFLSRWFSAFLSSIGFSGQELFNKSANKIDMHLLLGFWRFFECTGFLARLFSTARENSHLCSERRARFAITLFASLSVLCSESIIANDEGANPSSAKSGLSRHPETKISTIYSSPAEIVSMIRSYSPNGEILNIDVSSDGKSIVFESTASNLVRGDTNQTADVFLFIAEHRLLKRVSVDSNGGQVVGNSVNPRISPDGGWIVYESSAKGLDPKDENQFRDIYLFEVETGRTTLVSVGLDDFAGNRDSGNPVISRNAEVISFESEATNLVENDENKSSDVFAYSRLLNSVSLVSKPVRVTDADVNQGNLASYNPDLSDDGVYVTFESFSPNLSLGDYNSNSDVFLHNLISQTTVLISRLGTNGAVVFGDSTNPTVSGDGKKVVFQSQSQFFKDDLNKVQDAYVFDVLKNKLTKLPAEGLFVDESVLFVGSFNPVVSSDGSVIVYEIGLSAHEKNDQRPRYGRHLAYYDLDREASGTLNLFELNSNSINNVLDYSVSLSSDAEVLAFHVSRVDDLMSGQLVPKSGWLSKKNGIN